ncbi:DUF3131 domain-containing protein [Ramlibacter sp. MMS24-I3-19]|uniref:DUF3131 domain-containing protein n=1 Tax=Ramlibacter sp. MMS24-I3-19 TaxID=3416606 RepID=UPI003D092FE8
MQDSNWVKARSSIVWIAAIVVAFGSVWWIERQTGKELIARQGPAPAAAAKRELPASPDRPAIPAPRPLTAQEQQWARVAWSYFEHNTDQASGLVSAVQGFPSTSLWDSGSSLLALLAARDLALIDEPEFDRRLALALASLARLPLQGAGLPNKSYDVHTLQMTDYRNQPVPQGTGWSALDLGRLAVPLNAIVWRHPKHTEAVRRLLARWDLPALAQDGQLWGLQSGDGASPQRVQEGRLGYEQYAARALGLLGLDLEAAADPLAHLRLVDVQGIAVPVDDRDAAQHGALNVATSEPWMLQGLELGWTRRSRELAWRVYRAQEKRFQATGTLTAVSEDHVDQAPFFVYGAVWADGKPWSVVTSKGEPVPQLRTLSTKAAFAWHALLRTPYTQQLVAAVAALNDPAGGWYGGRYEAGGQPNQSLNANTNAVVLESLAYMAYGPLLRTR